MKFDLYQHEIKLHTELDNQGRLEIARRKFVGLFMEKIDQLTNAAGDVKEDFPEFETIEDKLYEVARSLNNIV